MNIKRHFESFDFLLVALVIGLSIFGVVVIGSATRINIYGSSTEFTSQKIWLATGIVLMLVAAFVNYNFICKFYLPVYIVNIILLVAVFIVDKRVRGVNRWFGVGNFGIQPSEFAKIFMIIFLSKFIDKKSEEINNILIFLLLLASVALPAILIIAQPSLSAGIILVGISSFILFVGKINYKHLLFTILILVPLAVFLYIDLHTSPHMFIDKILKDYQIDRILVAIDPSFSEDLSRQTTTAIHAIGSGMLMGKGLYGGTTNQQNYLFASESDFIFAVIGEEFGFIGCICVMIVIFLIIIKCLIIAGKASDMCGRLIAAGVAAMFFCQAFLNIVVAVGIVNTGVAFPFVSYGGSSLWVNMIAVGLVLNVGMSKPKSIFEG